MSTEERDELEEYSGEIFGKRLKYGGIIVGVVVAAICVFLLAGTLFLAHELSSGIVDSVK